MLVFFAEFIANNKPIVLIYKGKVFFPTFNLYKGEVFGLDSIVETDYKKLIKTDHTHINFYINPIIFWGYNESNYNVDRYPSAPTSNNLLGTDDRGRDVFTRIIYGFRISIMFALMNYFLALIFGVIIGGMQGFWGGKIDIVGQRFVEIDRKSVV